MSTVCKVGKCAVLASEDPFIKSLASYDKHMTHLNMSTVASSSIHPHSRTWKIGLYKSFLSQTVATYSKATGHTRLTLALEAAESRVVI